MSQLELTTDILSAALEGFEAQKDRIDARIAEIRQMLGGGGTPQANTATPKRKVSAAARRRMAKAQRLRWKKIKAGSRP
jgi:predicted transcriptional regulator